MPISIAIKGLQSIKLMQNVKKSGIPNKEDSEFIKLYMYEKERNRLKGEEIRILLRLEFIQNRLQEIQSFYDKKAEQMQIKEGENSNQEKTDWKTMSIDY
ncbi:MAG TPA: hypothetical protein DEO70_07600 [Bacteroidales bacterium]|nr:MAG: hypothetical protein A2X11_15490 [Bacteroidetes bacterium GWE2_42_24]OFY29311.1 MAG: hypothetical protein A2X09_06350 [Bacteroidetes bacterium GWF2_43_11]HBZ66686.1 hypothetical protein [Bacteroidales bacterium]